MAASSRARSSGSKSSPTALVERLRRQRFGEGRAQSRLDRVLECADRPSGSLAPAPEILAQADKVFMLGRKALPFCRAAPERRGSLHTPCHQRTETG
jgi:hypothetical protein